MARVLLLLARFGKEGKTEPMIPKISQEVLAQMVGTTRPRIMKRPRQGRLQMLPGASRDVRHYAFKTEQQTVEGLP